MPDIESDVEIVDEGEAHASGDAPRHDEPARVVAGVLGLTAFVTASLVGLGIGNPGSLILTRALVAMVVCALVGRLLGVAGERCVREFIASYKAERPIPEVPGALAELYGDDSGGGSPSTAGGKIS